MCTCLRFLNPLPLPVALHGSLVTVVPRLRKMFETMHTEHLKGRKVLLEKPSGFALFLVKEFALQEEKVMCHPMMHYPVSSPSCFVSLYANNNPFAEYLGALLRSRICNSGTSKLLHKMVFHTTCNLG